MSIMPLSWLCSTMRRNTPSAVGEQQIRPCKTNRTRVLGLDDCGETVRTVELSVAILKGLRTLLLIHRQCRCHRAQSIRSRRRV